MRWFGVALLVSQGAGAVEFADYRFTTQGVSATELTGLVDAMSVADAGHILGGPRRDLIVGDPRVGYPGSELGQVWVGQGGAPYGVVRAPSFTISPTAPNGWFGYSVDGGRDFNGDGVHDLAVAAVREWVPHPVSGVPSQDTGAVYVFFGPFTGAGLSSVDADAVFDGPPGPSFFGTGLAFVRDFDGDGLADLAIGASTANVGQAGHGAVWLVPSSRQSQWLGRHYIADLDTIQLYMPALSADFGGSLSALGDFDGSGEWDLAISASHVQHASVYILPDVRQFYLANSFGAHDVQDVAARYQGIPNNGESVGRSLDGRADLNGDGRIDLALSMMMHRDGASFVGGVAILPGRVGGATAGASFDLHAESVLYVGDGSDLMLGAAVAMPGDLNGDGFVDVVAGSPSDTTRGGGGTVWVRLGDGTLPANGTTGSITTWSAIPGTAGTHAFGTAIAGTRNQDWDPNADLIVGYHDLGAGVCSAWSF